MNCYNCKHELVWMVDHDISHQNENFCIMTELLCPMCETEVHVYYPNSMMESEDDD